jgi:hypothetical protein
VRTTTLFIKDLKNSAIFKTFFWWGAILAILLVTYINGVIEAFFISYWYKVYKLVKSKQSS